MRSRIGQECSQIRSWRDDPSVKIFDCEGRGYACLCVYDLYLYPFCAALPLCLVAFLSNSRQYRRFYGDAHAVFHVNTRSFGL